MNLEAAAKHKGTPTLMEITVNATCLIMRFWRLTSFAFVIFEAPAKEATDDHWSEKLPDSLLPQTLFQRHVLAH